MSTTELMHPAILTNWMSAGPKISIFNTAK